MLSRPSIGSQGQRAESRVKIGESAIAVAILPNRDAKSKISPLIYEIGPE